VLKSYHALNVPKKSKALDLGQVVHAKVLTPELYAKTYVVQPKLDARTKEGKDAKAKFALENDGKVIVPEEDAIIADAIASRIDAIPAVKFLLDNGKPELSFFQYADGIIRKARPDLLVNHNGNVILADLKTTSKGCDQKSFQYTCADYFYDLSAAYYIDIVSHYYQQPVNTFVFIVVETQPPHDIALYVLGKDSIDTGRKLYTKALERLKYYMTDPELALKTDNKIEFEMLELPSYNLQPENRGIKWT
jgi:exodeoxyribonuclease VIII